MTMVWTLHNKEFKGSIVMLAADTNAPIVLDVTTLIISGAAITLLLGVFLLSAWTQERIRALAWWGTAYLLGGFSVAVWSIENLISPPLPFGAANALLFLACGMIWTTAARIFHGRPVLWAAMAAGALVWIAGCNMTELAQSAAARIVLSSLIVSAYTFLTAAELWRERRKSVLRRWPAIFVPLLHGAVFLIPIPLASLLSADSGLVSLASGWIAVFALETMLYVIGTAFIVLVLAKEHTLRAQRDAAFSDELTGALNRRGFFAAAQQLLAQQAKLGRPVSVLMFDLDRFKGINDRFGHAVGDETLKLFAAVTGSTMRSSDIFARFGGEEFVALLPCALADASVAAERVRSNFEIAAATIAGHALAATVSVGAAGADLCADIAALLTCADRALYRAKANGRNRLEGIDQGSFPGEGARGHAGDAPLAWHVNARTLPAA
ncbi:MAG: GGDEF domain-containing protein [Alphaproteobacteria bacterium]|nr:MAG: GGDEF domain-containing protein [Alphaproteobacteria bacterium]